MFGFAHIYWALGGEVGLQGNEMTGVLLLINVVAIPLCFFATVVAVALQVSWYEYVSRRSWLVMAMLASITLGGRGSIGIAQYVLSPEPVSPLLVGYDVWFVVGGVVFGLLYVSHR